MTKVGHCVRPSFLFNFVRENTLNKVKPPLKKKFQKTIPIEVYISVDIKWYLPLAKNKFYN